MRHEIEQLIRAGNQFRSRGEARRAEPLLRRAVVVAESRRRDRHTGRELPNALNALGVLCKDLARHDEARALYERAFVLLEQSSADNDDVATLYHNLAGVEHARGDFVAAEPLARRGLVLRRRLGDHQAVAADLIALGAILDGQRKFEEAEAMYLEALAILERGRDPDLGEIAVALNNLGAQYVQRDRASEAIELLRRSERIKRERLGPRHPDLAVTLNNLASAHKRHGDVTVAWTLLREAVKILGTALGRSHPKTVTCHHNLSTLEKAAMTTPSSRESDREVVRIDLTAEQKKVVKAATSREADAIELTVDELEQRIAPSTTTPAEPGAFLRLAGNHNETLLADDR